MRTRPRQISSSGSFAVEQQLAADRAWVCDITYVPTREGWLYLAVVIDLANRMVVGWATKRTLDHSFPLAALMMAIEQRRPSAGLILHSDRGVQYACREYRAVIARYGILQSMSRKGDCWDNAVAESFFASLEWELIDAHADLARAQGHGVSDDAIDTDHAEEGPER